MPDVDDLNRELLAPPRRKPKAEGDRRLKEPPAGVDAEGELLVAPAILRATWKEGDEKHKRAPKYAIFAEGRNCSLRCPWRGPAAAIVYFEWLVGAFETEGNEPAVLAFAEAGSDVSRGSYGLVPQGLNGDYVPQRKNPAEAKTIRRTIFCSLHYSLARTTNLAELSKRRGELIATLPQLAGKLLLCSCEQGRPCHADVLSLLANRPQRPLANLRAALAVRWNFPVTCAWGNCG